MKKSSVIVFARRAGAVLLITLAMMAGLMAFANYSVSAETARPEKIKASTIKQTEVTVNRMTITFEEGMKASKYQLRYKKSDEDKWKTVTAKKNTVTLKKLKKDTEYKVQVRGVNNRSKGAWSKERTFRTLGSEYDVATDTVKRKEATVNTMTISFKKAAKATKYKVRYKKADSDKWTTVTTGKTTVTIEGLDKYTKYYVQVRGIKGNKKGAWTSRKTFTTLGDSHILTFDAGEYGELQDIEKKLYIRAGEEIGDMPIPLVQNTQGEQKLTFYNWSKKKGEEEPVIKETSLMPDRDMTVHAYYDEGGAGELFTFSDEGKLLKFGGENWIILDKMFTNGKPMTGMVLLLADDTKYSDRFSNFTDSKWEKSRAQKWCTNFYRTTGDFSDLEKSAIIGVKTTESTDDYTYNIGSRKIKLKGSNFDGTNGDKNKVFFLSAREYKIYNKSVTESKYIPTSKEWLLRTPGAEKNGLVATVGGSGKVGLTSARNKRALRPAINIEPSKFAGVVGSGTAQDPYAFCDQATVDRMAADEVIEMIGKLPDKTRHDTLTDKEKVEVERAVGAYNALTKAQKELIDKGTLWKLRELKKIIIGVLYEDEIVYNNIYIENQPNIVMENVTVRGDVTIKNARSVKMKNVTTIDGEVTINGDRRSKKILLSMDGVNAEAGCHLSYIDADAIDNLVVDHGQFSLLESTVGKFRRSNVNGSPSVDKAMVVERSNITLMENCEVRSEKTALHVVTFPGLFGTNDSIETLRHCYIWADEIALYLRPYAFIGTIDDTVLIAKNGRGIYGYANPRPVKTLVGDTIIYSGNGYGIQMDQHGDKGYLVVDRFTKDTVGQVRIYGAWGIDKEGEGAEVHFAAPDGYHLENTDERYNTVSNERLKNANDADFTGKKFYYVKKNDNTGAGPETAVVEDADPEKDLAVEKDAAAGEDTDLEEAPALEKDAAAEEDTTVEEDTAVEPDEEKDLSVLPDTI